MAQPEESPDKRTGGRAKSDSDGSDILKLLEPQILETAHRLGIKLALLKASVITDSAKLAEQLGSNQATKS